MDKMEELGPDKVKTRCCILTGRVFNTYRYEEYCYLEELGPLVRRSLSLCRGDWSALGILREILNSNLEPTDPVVDGKYALKIIKLDNKAFPDHVRRS